MSHSIDKQIDEYIIQNRYRLINSIVLLQGDKVVLERYYNGFNKESKNNIKSIWKSIISICIGICIDKGLIDSVTDKLSKYLGPFNQSKHPYHKLITIEHLLTMTSGIYWNGGIHYHCPMLEQMWRSDNWVEHISEIAMASVPGRTHTYKEWDVILLSAVITKVAGMTAYEFCKQYLYEPLEIKSEKWAESKAGTSYTISRDEYEEKMSDLPAYDLIKIGNLFLQYGALKNEQIVSKDYISKAIAPSKQDENYGYLWWLINNGYGCSGYGGQEINVLPNKKIVYVIQATPTPRAKSYSDVFDYLLSII